MKPRALVGVVFAALLVAAPASADDAVEAAAKARYAKGVKLYAQGRYEEARVEFLQASTLTKHISVKVGLGLASARVGRWVDALHAYEGIDETNLNPKQREALESGRREARGHVGRLKFEVPDGAEVTIDGKRADHDVRDPLDVAIGKHAVVVKHHDETREMTVDVAPEATADVKASFVPTPIAPVESRPRPMPVRADVGSETTSSILSPPETTWPVYVFGAVGVAGLATAAVFGSLAANSRVAVDVTGQTLIRNGQTRDTCAARPVDPLYVGICAKLEQGERLANAHQTVFITSVLVGASATALAVGWFFFAPKGEAKASARIVPTLGGATIEGRF